MKISMSLKKLYDNRNNRFGICSNAQNVLTYPQYIKTINKMKQWPKHSGSEKYPISTSKQKTPCKQYWEKDSTKWSKRSAYGRARWELLEWLINEFEKEGN